MIAVDTNVLIYACDQSDPHRQAIAIDLIAASTDGVLLWQVACEFLSASRKLSNQGFTPAQAWSRLAEFQDLLPLVLPTEANLTRAKDSTLRAECRCGMRSFSRHASKPAWRPSTRRTCQDSKASTASVSSIRSSD